MMDRYFENWVVRTYLRDDHKGWYDDHHINEGYAVGWSTSIVCHFLANYYWILGHEVNRVVIASLGLEDSAEHYSFDGTAPELARRHPSPGSPLWSDLPPYAWNHDTTVADAVAELRKHWTDPSEGQVISEQLVTKIVDPILKASGARPGRSRSSGILNGPPGTRKTSFVGRTATVIRWPLVTVPGSVILANGWDAMEARATEVFRQLKLLTNCVIFFDEYEEFFRARAGEDTNEGDEKASSPAAEGRDANENSPAGEVDSRTIAAFMTSGMLPRLQDLHDAQQCLVFLATNYPKNIDSAVRRAGRFDFNLTIPHPRSKRAIEYVEDPDTKTRKEVERLAKRPVDALLNGVKEAIVAYASAKGSDPQIPFKNIEDALRIAAQGPDHEAKERALRILKRGSVMDAPTLDELD
jgi:SpoVK/Ycf46/Vps4 family AAA+-type ATPase